MDYGGLRLKTYATIATARVRVTVDIGFGDAVEPEIAELDLPVLLSAATQNPGLPARSRHRGKVSGDGRTGPGQLPDERLLRHMASFPRLTFNDESLARAIAATFARRRTPIPMTPSDALTPAFAADLAKQQQWGSFLEGIDAEPIALADVVGALADFL